MSRRTEQDLKKILDFIEQKSEGKELSTDEMNTLLQQYMNQENAKLHVPLTADTAEDVYDYLELSDKATTKKKKRE